MISLGAVVLFFVYSAFSPSGGDEKQNKRQALVKNPPVTSKSDSRKNQDKVDSKLLHETPNPQKKEVFSNFLESNQDNPEAWAVVYDLTNDQSLLLDALSRFPDDRKLLIRAMLTLQPEAERLKHIERFRELFPKESISNYASAAISLRSGDAAKAVLLMRNALLMNPPSITDNDDILMRKKALENSGFNARDAALRSFSLPTDGDQSHGIFGIIGGLALSNLPAEEIGELGLGFAVHLRQTGAKNASSELRAIAFEESFLRRLPSDSEYGASGQTIGERLKEVTKEREQVFEVLQQSESLWNSASDREIENWREAAIAGGEIFAYRRWLRERK